MLKSKNELQGVVKSYPAVYLESPEYFWKVLDKTREAALSCTSDKATADFLQLASLAKSGPDLEEFVSEGIEKLCVTQPVCFRKTLSKLNEKNRVAVKKRLANRIYFEPPSFLLPLWRMHIYGQLFAMWNVIR